MLHATWGLNAIEAAQAQIVMPGFSAVIFHSPPSKTTVYSASTELSAGIGMRNQEITGVIVELDHARLCGTHFIGVSSRE